MENKFTFSPGFGEWLGSIQASLCFTSYDTGKVYFLGRNDAGQTVTSEMALPRPMGLAVDGPNLWISSGGKIHRFINSIPHGKRASETYDAVYLPRVAYNIGACDAHEIVSGGTAAVDDTIVFANTRFSCVSEIEPDKSFSVYWKPEFISKIVPEDRCHLNGICKRDGVIRYASMFNSGDALLSWKSGDARQSGGIVIDLLIGEIVRHGLSMPHSPRWNDGTFYILDSGRGFLSRGIGSADVAFCPGFLRGLSFVGQYAVCTLSKPRDGIFHGLELQRELSVRRADAICAVVVIDLETMGICHFAQIEGTTRELFDVQILPFKCATAFAPDTVQALNNFTGLE